MVSKKSNTIYLDYAATTPLDSEVRKVMEPYLGDFFGNPNSPHQVGRKALQAVDYARKQIACFLNCSPHEIIFTSGATESNNLALRGTIKAFKSIIKHPEIITSSIEHPSILKTCQDLEKEGIKISYLPVDQKGFINISSLQKTITSSTVLVTIMYANNEIGTIEPIREIGKVVEKINRARAYPVIFHTDAVQAAAYLSCNVDYLHVDLLSLSGHKIYAPKGIGILFVRQNIPFTKIQTGGDQEYGFRAGTQNVAGIVGIGKALEIIKDSRVRNQKKISQLRDFVIKEVTKSIPEVKLTGPQGERRLPNNIHFQVKGILGEDLMFLFDQEARIAVSVGSACTAGASHPSSVLLALGFNDQEAKKSIRITLGKTTSRTDLLKFISSFKKFVIKLSQKKIHSSN